MKTSRFFTHITVFLLTMMALELSAQVGINNSNITAASSAMLDIYSTDKGLLIPRLSTNSRDLIPSPAAGLVIYNTTTNLFNYYNGSFWYQIETTFVTSTTGTISPGGGVSVSAIPDAVPNNSAMLDVNDPIRGFLITRTTPGAITSPENGLIIYDLSTNSLKYFFDHEWFPVCAVTTGAAGATGTQDPVGVAISMTGTSPHHSAILDVASPNKGVLIPRLTSTQRDAIFPVTGLTIFNTTSRSIEYYNGSQWFRMNTIVPAGITIAANTTSVCAGTAVNFTATPVNGGATPGYQWKVNGGNISGATDAAFTYTPASNVAVTCEMTSSATCVTGNPALSNTINISVVASPLAVVSISASANPVCSGTSVIFTAVNVSGGGTNPAYQWKVNGINAGSNSSTFNYNPVHNDMITCVMTSSRFCVTGSPATSNQIVMSVNPMLPVSISVSPSVNPVCEGLPVTFTSTIVNGGPTPAYQWMINGSIVSGATNAEYTFVPVNLNAVACILTSNAICPSGNPDTSNNVTMSVLASPTAVVSISASANPVCTGASVTFTAVNVSGGGTNPAYQWKVNGINAGSNSSTFNYNPVHNDMITCVMTSSRFCVTGSPATSNPITMTVNPLLPASVSIEVVPSGAICAGTSVTFTATPTHGGTAPVYQWMNGVSPISGATNTTYTSSTLGDGNAITVVMTSNASPCLTGSPATSNQIGMTVYPTPTVNPVNNTTYCNEGGTTAIIFSGPVSGTTFAWTNNNISIGLTASGTGAIPSFTATNPGTAPVMATITVNPTANGCPGTPLVFTITVNPTPTVNPVSNATYCNGDATTSILFSSPVAGTTFNWNNNTTSIGLAANGIGNIPSFTATNTGTTPVIATITVTPTANGCTGPSMIFTLTVYPTPMVNTVSNSAYCNGATTAAITFSGPVAGTTFAWTNNSTSIGLAGSGTGNIPSFMAANTGTAPVVGTITVTPTANGCTGTSLVFTITVNPTPTVNPVSNATYCNGDATTSILFGSPVAGTTFNWNNNTTSIGLAANGAGNIPSFTATNTGSAPVTATITVTPVANGCPGPSIVFTLTVYPTPTVNTVSNSAYCNGATTAAITFSGPVSGTTFAWTNNATSIGLAGSGTGNIPSFMAANTGIAPVVATITVTPTANGCNGTSMVFTITVNPTPTVNPVNNATYCNGGTTNAISFSSPVAGTTFAWTNNNTSIGLAAVGTGNIPSYTATNTGTTPVTATITVTPTANGCPGPSIMFTLTVYPTPTVNTVSNSAYCNGATTAAIVFSGPVSGTTFAWTNNAASIGLATSGTGEIPSFTATNTGTAPVVATITVTPTANGCTGTSMVFTITVNPTPTVNPVSNAAYCNGNATVAVTLSSPVAGTTFTWTNNDTSIGLAAGGTGSIPTFTALNTGTAPVIATITVTPTANGCTGTSLAFTITVNPTPTVDPVNNATVCNGAIVSAISFTGPVAGTTFAWTNNTPSIGTSSSGTGIIPTFTANNSGTAPVIATITVTPTANGCTGTTFAFTITVYPTATVNPVNNLTYCNETNTTPITFSSPVSGTTFAWTNDNTSIGMAGSGTGNIPSFPATNTGTTTVTATITVTPTANGCTGTTMTFTITVYPTSTVNPVNNVTYCNGVNTSMITFTSPVSGTTFAWTNNTTSIGLAASGSGSIPSFSATNTGTTPVIANITVTPTANGCTGTALAFTITVYPTTTVNPVTNATYCNGVTTAAITLGSPVAGTTYTWTNNTPSIGLAANGTGNIPSFTATNTVTSPVIATITVTPTANGCTGTPSAFTFTVYPTSTVNPVNNATYCNGATASAITFTSPVAGTTFAWTNNAPSIGLAASGSGSIPSFTATNSGTSPVVATITVTPVANGCTGTSSTFTITVNPSLPVSITVTPSANDVCAGTSVIFSTAIVNGGPSPLYQWKLNGANINGATNATYTYIPLNNHAISCMLTSNASCATGTPATSNVVTMNVIPLVPVKASIVASLYAVMPGTSVTFTASVTNGGTTPVYQWKVNNLNVGTNSNTYTYIPLNFDKVTCTITSNSTVACLSNNPSISNKIFMIVYMTGLPCTGVPTVSYGGLTYNTVQVGTQCWLRENLNIGTRINNNIVQTNNGIVEKYCYNDSILNCDNYGGLYQWNELMQYVTTQGAQGICPAGWHVPTEAEFITLANFVGGASLAGGMLKEAGYTHFRQPNTGATNAFGFTALPTGYSYNNSIFSNMYQAGYFYTSTDVPANGVVFRSVAQATGALGTYFNYKTTGNPVRCLKNP